jgi:hypothetical protein
VCRCPSQKMVVMVGGGWRGGEGDVNGGAHTKGGKRYV